MPRYTVDFSPEVDQRLEELRAPGQTKAQVIRRALSLLSFVVDEAKNGGALVVENPRRHSKHEVVLL